MSKLIAALKKRFKSPAEALHALGLDPSILDVDVIAGDAKLKRLSRDQEFESDRERDDKLDQEFVRMLQAHPDIVTVLQKFLGKVLGPQEMTKFNQAIENLPEAEQSDEPDAEGEEGDQLVEDPNKTGALDQPEPSSLQPLPGGGQRSKEPPYRMTGSPEQIAGAKSAGAKDARLESRRLASRIDTVIGADTSADIEAANRAHRKAKTAKQPIATDARVGSFASRNPDAMKVGFV